MLFLIHCGGRRGILIFPAQRPFDGLARSPKESGFFLISPFFFEPGLLLSGKLGLDSHRNIALNFDIPGILVGPGLNLTTADSLIGIGRFPGFGLADRVLLGFANGPGLKQRFVVLLLDQSLSRGIFHLGSLHFRTAFLGFRPDPHEPELLQFLVSRRASGHTGSGGILGLQAIAGQGDGRQGNCN